MWKYLYRAVDSEGNALDFLLSAKRDAKAAKQFLTKVLNAPHTQPPQVITIDKNAAYPPAIDELKADDSLSKSAEIRQVKYLNNIVEQDHCFIDVLGHYTSTMTPKREKNGEGYLYEKNLKFEEPVLTSSTG